MKINYLDEIKFCIYKQYSFENELVKYIKEVRKLKLGWIGEKIIYNNIKELNIELEILANKVIIQENFK